jgi:hypothetical protein
MSQECLYYALTEAAMGQQKRFAFYSSCHSRSIEIVSEYQPL